MKTARQRKALVIRAARSRRRLSQLRDHSAAGSTKKEAAASIGMTVAGVDSLLYRSEGSTAWPIAALQPTSTASTVGDSQ